MGRTSSSHLNRHGRPLCSWRLGNVVNFPAPPLVQYQQTSECHITASLFTIMLTFHATHFIILMVFIVANSVSALIPHLRRNIVYTRECAMTYPQTSQRIPATNCLLGCHQSFLLHAKRSEDVDSEYCDEKEIEETPSSPISSSSPSPSSLPPGRIRNGNVLDVLAISVIVFFLATVWLSGGRLFNESLNKYNASNQGKTQVYKYIDPEKILREDFERNQSIMF